MGERTKSRLITFDIQKLKLAIDVLFDSCYFNVCNTCFCQAVGVPVDSVLYMDNQGNPESKKPCFH